MSKDVVFCKFHRTFLALSLPWFFSLGPIGEANAKDICQTLFSSSETTVRALLPHSSPDRVFDPYLTATRSNDESAARTAAVQLVKDVKSDPRYFKKIVDLLKKPSEFPFGRDLLSRVFNNQDNLSLAYKHIRSYIAAALKTERDSSVLLGLHLGAHRLRTTPRLEAASLRIKLQIHDRILELTKDADPNVSARASGLLTSYGLARDPRDTELLKEGLRAIQDGSVLKRSTLEFQHKGQRLQLEVTEQQELERRVALPPGEFTAKISVPSPIDHQLRQRDVQIRSSEEIVRVLLDRHSALVQFREKFSFRSLGSTYDHYHSGITESHTRIGTNPGQFTKTLKNLLNLNIRDGDTNSSRYIVTSQNEIATYFDSDDGRLKKSNLAVRLKEWHPVGETANPDAARARALFLKRTLPAQDPLFTNRQEIMIKLPAGADAELIDKVMRALLLREGVKDAEAMDLIPIAEVKNERLGFDLVWNDDIKVGYVVVDSYESKPPGEATSTDRYRRSRQWEVEILPQWQKLISYHHDEMTEFLINLEQGFSGQIDLLPKYQHTSQKIPVHQVASLNARISEPLTALEFELKEMLPGERSDDIDDDIHYMTTQEERDQVRVHAFEGKLHDFSGLPVDTNGREVNYVMDKEGRIYLGIKFNYRNHHSTYLGGNPVAAAGRIIVVNGEVKFIDNSSGHYWPTRVHLAQALARLREMRVPVSDEAVKPRPGT